MDEFNALKKTLELRFPGFEVLRKKKDEPWWLVIAFHFVALFNRRFYTSYVTTIGRKVYFPVGEREFDFNDAITLAHEAVHIFDADHEGSFRFSLRYLLPQVVGALFVLGFFGFAYSPLFSLFGFAVFLAPWPSSTRTRYEMRGYAVSSLLFARKHNIGFLTWKQVAGWYGHQFLGWSYYKMQWSDNQVRAWAHGVADIYNVKGYGDFKWILDHFDD